MRVAMVDRVDEESVSVRSGELAFGAVLGELLLVDQLKVPVRRRRCRGRRRRRSASGSGRWTNGRVQHVRRISQACRHVLRLLVREADGHGDGSLARLINTLGELGLLEGYLLDAPHP